MQAQLHFARHCHHIDSMLSLPGTVQTAALQLWVLIFLQYP